MITTNIEPPHTSAEPTASPRTDTLFADGITVAAACELTRRSKSTINNWVRAGSVRTAVDVEGTRLISQQDVTAFAAEHPAKGKKSERSEPVGETADPAGKSHDLAETSERQATGAEGADPEISEDDHTEVTNRISEQVMPPPNTSEPTHEQKVELANILLNEATQIRATISKPVVKDYAAKMKEGQRFPPVVLFEGDEGKFFIGDGWHRIFAARQNTYHSFPAIVYRGGKAGAIRYALKANLSHGLRLTSADRRKKVLIALAEFPGLSSNAIADACALSEAFVRRTRDRFVKDEPATRIGVDGKHYPPRKERAGKTKRRETLAFSKVARMTRKLTTDGLKRLKHLIEQQLKSIEEGEAASVAGEGVTAVA